MEISSVYYFKDRTDGGFEINVNMWPSSIDDATATWGAGQKTGHTVGGRNAIGYLIEIQFTPPNPFLQELLFKHLKLIRSFVQDLGDGSNTIARFWFNSSPDYNGVKRIHRDAIIYFAKLLKNKDYLVECDSQFLSDEKFIENTATTPSEIKELEEIKKQRQSKEPERQVEEKPFEEFLGERMTEFEKNIRIKNDAPTSSGRKEIKHPEEVSTSATPAGTAIGKSTMPKGQSPEVKKPKGEPPDSITSKIESSDPNKTGILNHEQLRKLGRENLKREKKAARIKRDFYTNERRRRQTSRRGKKAAVIIFPIITLVFLAVVFGNDLDLDSNEKIFSANLLLDSINNIELPDIGQLVGGCGEYNSISVNSQTTSGTISLLLCDGKDLTVSAKLSKSAQVQLDLLNPKYKKISQKSFINKEFEHVITPNLYEDSGNYKIKIKVNGVWLKQALVFKVT